MGILIENLSFHYTGTPVLDQVNLEVKDGDYAILTGENGSGKTTLMNFLKLRNQVELQFLHPKRKQLARLKILSRIQTAQR